jgi:hypothetical protein
MIPAPRRPEKLHASGIIAAVCAVLAVVTASAPPPTRTAPRATAPDIRLAVLGDVNHEGNSSTTSREGRLASSIRAWQPTAVAMVGDYQYQYGTCARLVKNFDRTGWGALMPRVITAAGPTHDYTSTASSASDYSRHAQGTCPGQTSGPTLSARRWHRTIQPFAPHYVDLGAWTVVSMPSGQWRGSYADAYGDKWTGAALTTWLTSALAAARSRGDEVVVMEHEPYWTSGSEEHSASEGDAQRPWIDALDTYDVRLVLGGHQHNYERFYPQRVNDARDDATGTQQFQVSTGGIGLRQFTTKAPNSAVQNASTYGWLRLVLHADGSYNWRFVPTEGSFSDIGYRPAR